jgi:putative transposase
MKGSPWNAAASVAGDGMYCRSGEACLVNHKKLFRLYREEKLTVRRRGGRKESTWNQSAHDGAVGPNDRWSLNFASDQLTDGRRFRILTVVDDFTRECLALMADTSLSGTQVARQLDNRW